MNLSTSRLSILFTYDYFHLFLESVQFSSSLPPDLLLIISFLNYYSSHIIVLAFTLLFILYIEDVLLKYKFDCDIALT